MISSALMAIGIIVIVYVAFTTHLLISYRKEIKHLKETIERIEVAVTYAQAGNHERAKRMIDQKKDRNIKRFELTIGEKNNV